MGLLKKLRSAWDRVKRDGMGKTLAYASIEVSESYHEWRLGIETRKSRRKEHLGITNPFSRNYAASDYRTLYRAFRCVPIRSGEDVFVDFGCGMGRVLIVAATFPFQRVIGLELSGELCAIAERNIQRAQGRLRCPDVSVLAGDATTYSIPSDATVLFFYNPFLGEALDRVLDNVRESLVRSPRRMTVVYKNTADLQPHLDRNAWLEKVQEFRAFDAAHQVFILRSVLPETSGAEPARSSRPEP